MQGPSEKSCFRLQDNFFLINFTIQRVKFFKTVLFSNYIMSQDGVSGK